MFAAIFEWLQSIILRITGIGAQLTILQTSVTKGFNEMAETLAGLTAKLNAANAAVTAIGSSVTGIGADVAALKAKIDSLTAGQVLTQADLDGLGAIADSMTANVATVGTVAADIDAQTDPTNV